MAVYGRMEESREKQDAWGCAACSYYNAESAACQYIRAPVSILFFCPKKLEKQE
jgi:hypothetical protein